MKKKTFSGEVQDSVIFPFYFLLHKLHKPIHPYLTHRPPISLYLGNVAKLICRRRIILKRDHHPPRAFRLYKTFGFKKPWSKAFKNNFSQFKIKK